MDALCKFLPCEKNQFCFGRDPWFCYNGILWWYYWCAEKRQILPDLSVSIMCLAFWGSEKIHLEALYFQQDASYLIPTALIRFPNKYASDYQIRARSYPYLLEFINSFTMESTKTSITNGPESCQSMRWIAQHFRFLDMKTEVWSSGPHCAPLTRVGWSILRSLSVL